MGCGHPGTRCTKLMRDCATLTATPATATALEVEIKFAAWAEGILLKMDDAQTQKMLNTEFGGMNEVLADLYADTGDKRWLDAVASFRSSRGYRSAGATSGHPQWSARQYAGAETARLADALHLRRRKIRWRGR